MTALGGITKIFSEIKEHEEDALFTGKAVEQMKKAFGNMNVDDAVKAFRGLGIEGDDLVEILLDCGVKSKDIEVSLSKAGKTGVSFTTKVNDGFAGLAGSIGLTSKALLGWIGGITAAVGIFTLITNVQKKMYENAQDGANAYKEQSASIDTYKSQISSLKESIDSGNLSEQEAYEARTKLLEIQGQIVSAYGSEAAGLDLLTMSADQATEALNRLNAAQAEEYLLSNKSVINNAKNALESEDTYRLGNVWTGIGSPDDYKIVKRRIQEIVDEYDHAFLDVKRDVFGNETTSSIVIEADAENAKEEIIGITSDLKKLRDEMALEGIDISKVISIEGIENAAETYLSKIGKTIDKYSDIYETANLAKIAESTNYSKLMSDMTDAQNQYNETISKSYDSEEARAAAVRDAIEGLITAKQAFSNMDFAGDAGVESVFSEMVNAFDDIIQKEEFHFDVTATVNGSTPTQAMSDIVKALKVFENDDGVVDPYSILNAGMGSENWDASSGRLMSDLSERERAYLQLQAALAQYGYEVEEAIPMLQQWGLIQKANTSTDQETVKSYTDMATAVSDLKSELSTLNSAASEQGYSGNISPETYDALIAKSKDYAACIEYQNGALQLNTEKANALFEAKSELQIAELELQKIADATKWKENADEIERLTKEYDGLDGAIKDQIESLKKENAGIEANLVGYDIQIAAIEELTSAYGRWKAVSESDNSDSMYKDIQKAYEQIKEAQKTGQTGVGNVVYQAAVELLVPDGEDVKKYMGTLKRYITDGSSGLTNFINDMVSKGLMERSKSDWNKVSMVAGTTVQEILDKMTLTPEMAKSIFNALEMYDFDFDWTDEDFNINTDDALAKLKAAQEEMNKTIAKINEMKAAGATVDLTTGLSLDDLEKQYAEQKKQVDKLVGSATGTTDTEGNKIEYNITTDTTEAEEALEDLADKLDEIADKIKDLAKKIIGTFGAFSTLSVLSSVYDRLKDINNYKIADKSFNVYENVISSSSTAGGSSTHTSSSGVTHGGGGGSFDSNASGTKHADAGIALVGDEYSPDGSPKPELIITDGAAYVAGQSGPEFVNLNDGDQVIPADQTKKILSGNPSIRRNTIPAFATGAGGYAAGSIAEQMYLDGRISATQEWIKQQEQKKKDDELIKQLSAKAAEKSADDTYLNNNAAQNANSTQKTYLNTSVTVGGGGNAGSLTNSGGSGGSSSSGSSSSSESSSTSNEKSQFEKDYEYHQHLLAMEQESYEDYIEWLNQAYKEAYANGTIELEDYYKYSEEVLEGQKQLFQDSIGDIEHKIRGLEREPGNERQIINYYNQIIADIDKEILAARARGLSDDDDYIQELLEQKWDYADEVADIEKEILENAKEAVEDLVDYRVDMLKQDIENEKDAANDKLDTLKDFYDKQKEMLHDVYDEEKYLEEQSEKRKTVDDIRAEMDMLKFDDSAKAQKRIKELQEELKDAEKELTDFEKDHALENATDLLDKMYEQQEKQIQSEIDALDERLNDPEALYNQALRDIQNNTLALYEEMLEYNRNHGDGRDSTVYDMWTEADKSLDAYFKAMGQAYKNILLVDAYKPTGYASGTSNATPGIHELFEGNKDEYVLETSDGHRYKMFSGLGKKVLNASATDFLYKFANNGEAFISNMINGMLGSINNVSRPTQQIQLSTGDVIVQGNATAETVSAIRRAQRDNIDFVLREFTRLNR